MSTVAEIVEAAREENLAFDRTAIPVSLARRFLERYVKRLTSRVLEIAPHVLTQPEEVALPLAVFADGAVLPEASFYTEGWLQPTGNTDPGMREGYDIVPYDRLRDPDTWPAVAIQGSTLFLGGFESWWTPWDMLVVQLVPEVGPFTDATAVIPLPESADDALVAQLAYYMARRAPGDQVAKSDRGELRQEAREAEHAFLRLIGKQRTTEFSQVREVW